MSTVMKDFLNYLTVEESLILRHRGDFLPVSLGCLRRGSRSWGHWLFLHLVHHFGTRARRSGRIDVEATRKALVGTGRRK